MKTHKDIQNKVDNAFRALDAIEEVKVSPFFKDRTLQRLFAEKEEQPIVWLWFTPRLQFATLIGIVVLNVFAFTRLHSNTYNDNVNNFAETYGLSTDLETSFINK